MVITENKLIVYKNNLWLCPNWLVKKVRGQIVKNGTEIWLSQIFCLNLPESFGELGQTVGSGLGQTVGSRVSGLGSRVKKCWVGWVKTVSGLGSAVTGSFFRLCLIVAAAAAAAATVAPLLLPPLFSKSTAAR